MKLADRYPVLVWLDERYRMEQVRCNLFKAKNPAFVVFFSEESEGTENDNAAFTPLVSFTKRSLIPTFAIKVSKENEAKIREEFHFTKKLPCVTAWSEGQLVSEEGPGIDGVSTYLSMQSFYDAILNYIAINRGDVKAYRLMRYYEDLKKQEEGEVS